MNVELSLKIIKDK